MKMPNKIIPIDNKFYVTRNGQKAEREALASGRIIKIVSVVVDSTLLPASSSPEYMNAVQDNPTDSDGVKAIYPVGGNSVNDQLLVAWTLPANSGGYHINGLGFILEDGTLWGYQRVQLGYKAPAGDGALFEPKGLITHETSAATSITFNLSLDDIYATIDDVNYLINEHKKDMWRLMRKMEGKVGRVRLYMANDVDDDYLVIRGQTITKVDYPDYFKHLGVTTSSLKLPDWSRNGYIRQFSDSLNAGATLTQQILRHNHTGTIGNNGGHTPTSYPIDLGNKTGSFSVSKRFYTSDDGAHDHEYTSAMGGGTDKTDPWSGSPSDKGGNKRTGGAPKHKHFIDVSFSNVAVNVTLGTYNVAHHSVAHHSHVMAIDYSGHDENRPNTTVAVYAVKVKYLTPSV